MTRPKILIVDDERDSTFALEKTLSMKGYSVLTAEKGQTAIQIAQSEKPDLILLDIMLPDMHGGDVAKVLQANADTKDIPIIFPKLPVLQR
jgi:DNA-binding response OmpR family regulator